MIFFLSLQSTTHVLHITLGCLKMMVIKKLKNKFCTCTNSMDAPRTPDTAFVSIFTIPGSTSVPAYFTLLSIHTPCAVSGGFS